MLFFYLQTKLPQIRTSRDKVMQSKAMRRSSSPVELSSTRQTNRLDTFPMNKYISVQY